MRGVLVLKCADASMWLQAAGADLRILIAVTSECCSSTSKSSLRRAEARQTWAKHIREKHSGAVIRFVLAQPPADSRCLAQHNRACSVSSKALA